MKILFLVTILFPVLSLSAVDSKPWTRLRWKKVDGASAYLVEIFKDRHGKELVFKGKSDSHRYVYENPKPGVYHWRIATVDGWKRTGDFSPIKKVLIMPNRNSRKLFEYISPGPNQVLKIDSDKQMVTFKWKTIHDPKDYTFYLFKKGEEEPQLTGKLKDGELSFPPREYKLEGEYVWKVAANYIDGVELIDGPLADVTFENTLPPPKKVPPPPKVKKWNFNIGSSYSSLNFAQDLIVIEESAVTAKGGVNYWLKDQQWDLGLSFFHNAYIISSESRFTQEAAWSGINLRLGYQLMAMEYQIKFMPGWYVWQMRSPTSGFGIEQLAGPQLTTSITEKGSWPFYLYVKIAPLSESFGNFSFSNREMAVGLGIGLGRKSAFMATFDYSDFVYQPANTRTKQFTLQSSSLGITYLF